MYLRRRIQIVFKYCYLRLKLSGKRMIKGFANISTYFIKLWIENHEKCYSTFILASASVLLAQVATFSVRCIAKSVPSLCQGELMNKGERQTMWWKGWKQKLWMELGHQAGTGLLFCLQFQGHDFNDLLKLE